tara:strand:+ start:352 stop:801 length:450 start_codon:yes stop_codon:yes gene_type:complete
MKHIKKDYLEQEDKSMKNSRKEVLDILAEYEDKYFDLVWYARKHPIEDKDYWDKVPKDIREGAFECMKKVEAKYPREVKSLSEETGISSPDWEHGFNSGCLAAFRFAVTTLSKSEEYEDCFLEELEDDDEFELPSPIDLAIEEFPFLDT